MVLTRIKSYLAGLLSLSLPKRWMPSPSWAAILIKAMAAYHLKICLRNHFG